MQKVIIDTNVLISAFIQRNYPFFIVHHCVFESLIDVCISDALMAEYLQVLKRPKFYQYPDFLSKAELVLAHLEAKAIKFYPKAKVEVIADSPDNPLLELAIESKANFIITGNTNDFTLAEYHGTKIVSPRDCWELYRE